MWVNLNIPPLDNGHTVILTPQLHLTLINFQCRPERQAVQADGDSARGGRQRPQEVCRPGCRASTRLIKHPPEAQECKEAVLSGATDVHCQRRGIPLRQAVGNRSHCWEVRRHLDACSPPPTRDNYITNNANLFDCPQVFHIGLSLNIYAFKKPWLLIFYCKWQFRQYLVLLPSQLKSTMDVSIRKIRTLMYDARWVWWTTVVTLRCSNTTRIKVWSAKIIHIKLRPSHPVLQYCTFMHNLNSFINFTNNHIFRNGNNVRKWATLTKHRKNCECCPVSQLIVRKQRLSWIQVLNCQNCSQCLKCQKSLGLLLGGVLKMSYSSSLSLSLSLSL